MKPQIVRNEAGQYRTRRPVSEEELLGFATELLSSRFTRGEVIQSPQASRDFLTFRLAREERELFGVVFLDSQHRVLAYEVLFQGSISSSSVHPREVVKRCLVLNAAAVVLAHNHPSGEPEPSPADRAITERLVQALDLIEVRVLDHFVVGGARTVSFAERGWL